MPYHFITLGSITITIPTINIIIFFVIVIVIIDILSNLSVIFEMTATQK